MKLNVRRIQRFVMIALPLCYGTVLSGADPRTSEHSSEFVRLMNLGKAYLENRDSKKALEVLDKAVGLEPASAPALRNLARAHLLARDTDRALEILERAAPAEPGSPATYYLTGLAEARRSRFERAVDHFDRAVRLDPHTATLRYQLANCYQSSGRDEDAIRQLKETVRLDPLHAAAHFRLSGYARKAGNRKEFQARTREFLRLRKLLGEAARSAVVLEQCVYTRPEAASQDQAAVPQPAIDVKFVDATQTVFTRDGDSDATAACVLEVDDLGRPTVFVAGSKGALGLLRMSPDGLIKRTELENDFDSASTFEGCIAGDFHDDVPKGVKYDAKIHALNDVLLFGPAGIRLLKRMGANRFLDVTEAAGLVGLTARHALWVDYDHDGDLDLALARETGAELWQNNGDGRFENVTAKAGLGDTGPAYHIVANDFDANVAVDLVVACGDRPTLLLPNQRAGRFGTVPDPPGPWPAANRVLTDDLTNDGHPDVLLVTDHEGIVIPGRTSSRTRIDMSELTPAAAALLDYDNDGRLDVCAAGTKTGSGDRGAIRLWRNVTGVGSQVSKWTSVHEATGLAALSLPPVRDILPVDFDADGDTDLFLVTADRRLRWLRNDGGNANGQLKLHLTTIKSNPSGIGTHVEIRDGTYWLTRNVSRPVVEIGIGAHKQLDAVQTLWTSGVVDNRIDVTVATKPLAIVEKNVATGSCPFSYVWDGRRFRFVTDVLGNSPIGLSLQRDVMLPADPDEIVLIGDSGTIRPLEGAFTVKITEEYCETLYLDSVRLLAVDHAVGVEVHSTDKISPEPFPPSGVSGVASIQSVIEAVGDDGIVRTEALAAIDGEFAPPGPLLPPPFRGMCHPMAVTLDFGPIDASRPLVLILTGWLRYGQASTNIALSQSKAHTVIPPTLEVQTSDGSWHSVDVVVGMPAGKTKTILCDLTGKLPPGAGRLRLTTTFEIRWDRIALGERAGLEAGAIHELLPAAADLQWHGFSQLEVRAPGHPKTPDHDVVFERPPWRTVQQGWCTRYGDVRELVVETDDRLAILNAGDEVTLRFDADSLPPIPPGQARTFFLYTFGWEKDGDHNVVGGDAVGPLPSRRPPDTVHENVEEDDWRLKYNTRWISRDRFRPSR